MTISYFIELSTYNIWANDIVFGWLEKINDEQWNQPIISSFNSIAETALHVASAEKAWLERLKKQPFQWLANDFSGTKNDVINIWKTASQGLKNFVTEMDENTLTEKLEYKRLNGNLHQTPYYQIFAHVFNHSTYHRGQLVTMLRQAGFINVSSTDMTSFFRG